MSRRALTWEQKATIHLRWLIADLQGMEKSAKSHLDHLSTLELMKDAQALQEKMERMFDGSNEA